MTGAKSPADEETVKKLEDTLGLVDRDLTKGKGQLAEIVGRVQARMAAVKAELAGAQERRAKLEPHKTHPEGGFHYRNMELVVRVNTAFLHMLDVELAAAHHNATVIDAGTKGALERDEKRPFKDPEEDLGYIEARVRMDLYLVLLYWAQNLEGVDAVLRAMANENAVPGANPADEAKRAAAGDALTKAAQGNRDLHVYLTKLTEDLQETQALIEWAHASLETLPSLPPPSRREALADNDYVKLGGKVYMFANLGKRLAEFPDLAKHFGAYKPVLVAGEAPPTR